MCWHKWSKWEQYVETGEKRRFFADVIISSYPYSEEREKRKCEKCGAVQNRLVKKLED
jgi:hypothetical protein